MSHHDDPSWMEYQHQMNSENLRTLAILHRVYAGFLAATSCCLIGYLAFILGMLGLASSSSKTSGPPPAVFGVFIAGMWGFVFAGLIVVVILNLLCANWIRDRRNWAGVVIVSGINCLNMPVGAALGVFTLIVVNRPTVRPTFE